MSEVDNFKQLSYRISENGDFVSLSYEEIDITKLQKFVTCTSAGAISSFIGITRDNFDGRKVVSLSYEGYEDMVLEQFLGLCLKVCEICIYLL